MLLEMCGRGYSFNTSKNWWQARIRERLCLSTLVIIRAVNTDLTQSNPLLPSAQMVKPCCQAIQIKPNTKQALSSLVIFIFLILFLIFIKKTTIIKKASFTRRLLPGRTLVSVS